MNTVQCKELEVLKEIIKVLDAHNLTYYAIGGTCIGAIRHKGFIPWDDDIDIALPRSDYEKFRTEYYKELPSYLEKLDGDNAPHHRWMFLKIHDARTTYISDYAEGLPDIYTGAFVDIMPMDGMPSDENERAEHIKKLKKFLTYNEIIRDKYKTIDSPKRLAKEIVRFLLKHTHKWNYYSMLFQRYSEKYDYYKSENVCYNFHLYSKLPVSRIIFPRKNFDKQIKATFETIELNVPELYDPYLRSFFGDYMQFPPEDKRNSGHESIASDMNIPYRQYKF